MATVETIKKWLRSGIEIAENKFKFEIENEAEMEDGYEIFATSELGGLQIGITENKGILVVYTGIEDTTYWELDDRMKAYRIALRLNEEIPQASIFMMGEDDDLFVKATFDVKKITKSDFEDLVNSVYILRYLLWKKFAEKGLVEEEEEDEEDKADEFINYIISQLEEGRDVDDLAKEIYEGTNGEVSSKEAKKLVKDIKDKYLES